jgi:Na+/proline symporter
MTWATLAILAYVLVQFAVGAWVSRRISTERDYILAGRSLGAGLIAFSVFATWFGAEAVQVSAGEIYENGLAGALIEPFGYGAAVIIVGLILATPLWRQNITTFADMIRTRYSPAVETAFVIVLVPGSLFWASAQIRAFGQILSASSSFSVTTAILVAGILVAAYSTVGGLLADAITDVVQGLVVIGGLLVLALFVASAGGGIGASLSAIEPSRLVVHVTEDGLDQLEKMAGTICGSIVSIELISRFLGAHSAQAARNGTIAGGVMYILVGLLPVFLGLVGAHLLPGVEETEQIVPKLAETYMPVVGYAVFVGALVSAILSVVHAALHAPASQISHNIIPHIYPGLSSKARLVSVRLCVLALSIVCLLLAYRVQHIRDLVEIASAFGSAGAVVVAAFGLYTRFGGPKAAMTALLSGVAVWGFGKLTDAFPAPYLVALGFALGSYVLVTLLERKSSEVESAKS